MAHKIARDERAGLQSLEDHCREEPSMTFPGRLRNAQRTAPEIGHPSWAWLALMLSILVGCAAPGDKPFSAQTPKNIVIVFADGTAATQWDFGSYSSRVLRGRPFATTDTVFRSGSLGLMSTHPDGPYVTDSAAAASAMSTGFKVANGAVSITPD